MKLFQAMLIPTLLFSTLATANQCPNLAGKYFCTYPDASFYELHIDQSNIANDVTVYRFLYPAISSTPEEVHASDQGISDGMGWIVACSQNQMVSTTINGAYQNRSYLDEDGNFVSWDVGLRKVICAPLR